MIGAATASTSWLVADVLAPTREFSEQKSVAELLAGLEKDALLALITRLVQNNPDLYDVVEMAIPAVSQPRSPKRLHNPKKNTRPKFPSRSIANR